MALTVLQLLAPPSSDSIKSKLLSYLQNPSSGVAFPITDWTSGGVARTLVEMEANALNDLVGTLIPAITSGVFADYAAGDWLTLLAAQRYNLLRNFASSTTGAVVLTCASTSGPYTITAGQLWFQSTTGNRYVNTTGGTLSTSGTLSVQVQSEALNHSVATSSTDTAPLVNYNDGINSITQMITTLAGVTANNPPSTFNATTAVHTGPGTGVITPSGSPISSHSITVQILQNGQVGTAVWQTSTDGAPYVYQGTASSVTIFGTVLTLSNGSGNPSFLFGDTYKVNWPGTWVTSQGTDQETDVALLIRMKARWPSLSAIPNRSVYDLLARVASSSVTQTLVVPDGTINNQINIYVAGAGGVLPGATVVAIQAYISARSILGDIPIVQSPTSRVISLGGATITVQAALLTSAQQSIQSALLTYFNSLGINGLVRQATIVRIIVATPGVIDVTDQLLAINGVIGNLQLPLAVGAVEAPSWTQSIATALNWATV